MRPIVMLAVFMGLILSGCSTQPCSPQIVKVPQKTMIQTPPLPNIINAKQWCKPNERECIDGIGAYNFVEVTEFAAKYHVNVRAHR